MRRFVLGGFIFASALGLAFIQGCAGLKYYAHLAGGQYEMCRRRVPIADLLKDPETDPGLARRLTLVNRVRAFARKNLDLATGGRYASYADLGRSHALWVVFATPEFSLTLKTWRFPLAGEVGYKAWFSEKKAEIFAQELKDAGMDVDVAQVDAYSTLGYLDDPVLNTFVYYPEAHLAELIFHELAHGRLYVDDDTTFNESFATAVALEGIRRWLKAMDKPTMFSVYLAFREKKAGFIRLIRQTGRHLQTLYDSGVSVEQMRDKKAAILQDLKARYLDLKQTWGGYAGFDHWFSRPLNNARIASEAAYHDLAPGFLALLHRLGNDLPRFYAACEDLARLSPQERKRALMKEARQGESLEMRP